MTTQTILTGAGGGAPSYTFTRTGTGPNIAPTAVEAPSPLKGSIAVIHLPGGVEETWTYDGTVWTRGGTIVPYTVNTAATPGTGGLVPVPTVADYGDGLTADGGWAPVQRLGTFNANNTPAGLLVPDTTVRTSGSVWVTNTAPTVYTLPPMTPGDQGHTLSIASSTTNGSTINGYPLVAGQPLEFVWAANSTWQLVASGPQPVRKYRVVQPLTAGANIITHNLNLTSTPVTVEVRDNSTGALITARVTAEAANTTTINVPIAVASARITLIG